MKNKGYGKTWKSKSDPESTVFLYEDPRQCPNDSVLAVYYRNGRLFNRCYSLSSYIISEFSPTKD